MNIKILDPVDKKKALLLHSLTADEIALVPIQPFLDRFLTK